MRYLPPLLVLLTTGCLDIIGGGDGSECDTRADCPSTDVCDTERGRCVGFDGSAESDMRVHRPDADPRPDMAAAEPDAAPDMIPDAAPDMAPDMAAPPEGIFGATADCFSGDDSDTFAEMPSGSTHVPRGLCTSHLLAWTAERDGEVKLLFNASGDLEDAPRVGPTVIPDTRVVADGEVLLMAAPHPRHGVPNIQRVDLARGAADFLQPRNARQSQPARTPGLSAFVELGDTTRHVRLQFDDPLEGDADCIRADRHQWGVRLGTDWVAFFERDRTSRRTDLVITRGHRCDGPSRVLLPLPGLVSDDATITAAAGRLFWIATDPNTRLRGLWTLDRADLVAGPRRAALPTVETINPVDVAGRGDWLAVVSYRPGGYRLDVFDLAAGEQRLLPNSAANALQPTFSDSYLLWAEQSAASPWEVRYARLADL